MQHIHIIEELGRIIDCFIISVIASFARVLLYKNESFKSMLVVFFGGMLFGTLVGYLIGTFPKFSPFDKLCTAFAAILGREIVNFLIVQAPAFLKSALDRLSNIKIGTK